MKTHDVTCYFWHEGEGGLDADVFASCLHDYITNDERCKAADKVVIYSDGCTYQNRNVTLANMLMQISVSGKTIIQKFLEKGHTQMECDSVHATCERAFRNRPIYVPANYVELIKTARKTHPYQVKYLTHEFFSTFPQQLNSIRPGKRVGDPVVTDLRQIKYEDGSVFYKLRHVQEQFEPLPRPRSAIINQDNQPSRKYTAAPKIKKTKFEHLKQLKKVMPQDYHAFYDSLSHQ
jgi:hypothetical protein